MTEQEKQDLGLTFLEAEIENLDRWIDDAKTEESRQYFEGMQKGYRNALSHVTRTVNIITSFRTLEIKKNESDNS